MLSASCSTNTVKSNGCEWIKLIHPMKVHDECMSDDLAKQILKHNKKVEANCK
jgi:hypothetical protein